MKATKKNPRPAGSMWRRRALGLVGALALSAVMLFCVACTSDNMTDTGTTAGTTSGTAADSTGTTAGSAADTDSTTDSTSGTDTESDSHVKPLDPDAGTVEPGTDSGSKMRPHMPRFMH